MVKRRELNQETLTYLDLAKSSNTYAEYVFKCEILQKAPKSEYEYDCNHWGHILQLDPQSGDFFMREVEKD